MTAESTASTELPAAGTYRIHPEQSTVCYRGRHMFGLGVVNATFRINSGEILVADQTTSSTVTVSIDADSFASRNMRRDSAVRSAALLDTAAYPDIKFSSHSLRSDADGWLLSGDVTAHSTSVPTEVVIVQVTHEPDGIRVHAHVQRMDRYAFGVTRSKGFVGRYLHLTFDIFAIPV